MSEFPIGARVMVDCAPGGYILAEVLEHISAEDWKARHGAFMPLNFVPDDGVWMVQTVSAPADDSWYAKSSQMTLFDPPPADRTQLDTWLDA